MKNKLGYLALIAIAIGVAAYFYMDASEIDNPRTLTALERTGDECGLIAEKAAQALPEVLPFQKLEKTARQARVLQSCMNDRGYIENPAWVKHAQAIVTNTAKADNISENEAYETFRRSKMKTFYESNPNTPLYWIVKQ